MTERTIERPSELKTERTTERSREPRWGAETKAVRRVLKFIKAKGSITRDELIAWDAKHGRALFTWDDSDAAHIGRLWEAGIFLNRFRAKFEGMRVRAFIHVDADEEVEIEKSAYYGVEAIASHPGMRAQVIEDITRRMAGLAAELKMWKLDESEQRELFDRMNNALQ